MKQPLKLFSDFSERFDYNYTDFPVYIRQNYLSHYGFCATSHWHNDLEFILVKKGTMDYFINGRIVQLTEGNGIFVNSKRLHYGFSDTKEECVFFAVIISPSLFFEHSLITQKYFHEKFGALSQDYIHLDSSIDWQKGILNTLSSIYGLTHADDVNIIRLLSYITCVCADIGERLIPIDSVEKDDYNKNMIWKMTDYIHRNYDKKISLDSIAESGVVCRSKCCELFRNYLLQSPNVYLNRYRLTKSCELLRNTNMSISEIALSCGFQSSSYFTSVFCKKIGMIPKDFRKRSHKNTDKPSS
ncbi:helix-turn-helix transcriptional regulator [Listeria monocytogenes]|nr:helix-turn-helix transcriptional regulator [Listeria monocytogenes]